MIEMRPATSGYRITLKSGDILHVWPDIGLVVSELAGEAQGAGITSPALAAIPLTHETAGRLATIWSGLVQVWRGRR